MPWTGVPPNWSSRRRRSSWTCTRASERPRTTGAFVARRWDVPRVRTRVPQGTLHVLQASARELNRIGYKAYYSSPTGTRFHVHLYDMAKGPLDAIVGASKAPGGAWAGLRRLALRCATGALWCSVFWPVA